MTRGQLAVASGVSASYVTSIENGSSIRRLGYYAGSCLMSASANLICSPSLATCCRGTLKSSRPDSGKIDPYVVTYLSRELVVVHRAVIGVFTAMREAVAGMVRNGAMINGDSPV